MTTCHADCGSCCDPVVLGWDPEKRAAEILDDFDWTKCKDPATEEGWPDWERLGWDREHAIRVFTGVDDSQVNMRFIRENWTLVEHEEGSERWAMRCAFFNATKRTCEAYAQRPPVCSGFPWYGREPKRFADGGTGISHGCAYQADVRTVLPIVEVTHGRDR